MMQVKGVPVTIEAVVLDRKEVSSPLPASATGDASEPHAPRARRRGRRLSTIPERQIRCPACGQLGRPGRMEVVGIPVTIEVCEFCVGTVERVSQFVSSVASLLKKRK